MKRLSPSHLNIILPAVALLSADGADSAFVATQSWKPTKSTIIASRCTSTSSSALFAESSANDNSNIDTYDDEIEILDLSIDIDSNRRKLFSASAAALPFVLSSSPAIASIFSASASTLVSSSSLSPPLPVQQINAGMPSSSSKSPSPPKVLCADTEEESRIAIFENVAPSVVYIDTFSEKRDVITTNIMEVPVGSGSGIVWNNEGYIITNFHVVQEAKSAQVSILTPGMSKSPTVINNPSYTSVRPGALGTTKNGGSAVLDGFTRSVYRAKVVGIDPTKDIAVLKVDDVPKSELRPIDLGTSVGLRVGQGSLAIGNPFGLDHTLTTGVVSGIGREVKSPAGRPISNVIQTDAAINPGNSGGPLLNSSGKMIGMATAIYSPSGASAGVGFAIPVDTVKSIVGMLIQNGQIVRPLLGISILDSKQARQALGITKGVLILDAKPGTPAAKAGLKGLRRTESGIIEIGDIITAIEGTPIEMEGDLFKAIESFEPGDVVKVTVNRPDIEVGQDGTPKIKLKELVFPVKLIASDDTPLLKRKS